MAVRRLTEDVKTYYDLYYGGTWNGGSRSFSTEQELIKFLKDHVFDTKTITINKVEKLSNEKYSKYITYCSHTSKDLTTTGSRQIFDSGITSIDNLKDSDMTESLNESSTASSLDEWDIETIASMIEDWLYDRNFIVNRRKIWGNTIDFTVSYKYDDSHDTVTVYAKDFENLPEDEWFNMARTKAEDIAEIVLDT